jgi:hypothetical protein
VTSAERKLFAKRMYVCLWQKVFPEKVAARNKRWRSAHRAQVSAARLRYVARNSGKVRRWQRANPDKRSAITGRYYRKHKAKCSERNRSWKSRNKPKVCAHAAKRRTLLPLKSAPVPRAIAKIYARAEQLRQWFAVVVDHVKPLCRGGLHEAKNLQIIYDAENARKGSRLDYTPSVIFA